MKSTVRTFSVSDYKRCTEDFIFRVVALSNILAQDVIELLHGSVEESRTGMCV